MKIGLILYAVNGLESIPIASLNLGLVNRGALNSISESGVFSKEKMLTSEYFSDTVKQKILEKIDSGYTIEIETYEEE